MNRIHFFGDSESTLAGSVETLGNKGFRLAELAHLGFPIPAGFTIPTSASLDFFARNQTLTEELCEEIRENVARLEKITGLRFGDPERPLLVSVRSGSAVSMPGMMDTVLNVGLNSEIIPGLERAKSNDFLAWDCWRRLLQMYSTSVAEIPKVALEEIISRFKKQTACDNESQFSLDQIKELCREYQQLHRFTLGEDFPENVWTQLFATVAAVFRSWNGARARKYRQIHKIPDELGTAVTICAMVYGNHGERSGTGVYFTRNPSSGEDLLYGEFLSNAQGEDVVAGIRTPKPISVLQELHPDLYVELRKMGKALESHFREVQDIEFTIESGRLYLLQARTARCFPRANLVTGVALVREGILSKESAILRVDPVEFEKLLQPIVDPRLHKQVIARGLAASPGAATGRVVFTSLVAEQWATLGEPVILVRDETSPEDIGGIHSAQGLLTVKGGMTCHAAIVARQMGKSAVTGCNSIQIDLERRSLRIGGIVLQEGDWITLDGSSGEIILGKVATREAILTPEFSTFLDWARALVQLEIRANCDSIEDAHAALQLGATGIGLCRTERMFFDDRCLALVREAIIARNVRDRTAVLNKLQPIHQVEFAAILEAMDNKPVTIRLFDHPFSLFMPSLEEDIFHLAEQIGIGHEEALSRIRSLRQTNPGFGHRGCRLGISHPEIYDMQIRALAEATATRLAAGGQPQPEILLPMVSQISEISWLKKRLEAVARHAFSIAAERHNLPIREFAFRFGILIEVPRTAILADQVAQIVDFISFGTNDLTQTVYGMSRDDRTPFLKSYRQERIMPEDPFEILDRSGVGYLMDYAVTLARRVKSDIPIGVCGEHGSNPQALHFFQELGVSYVSTQLQKIPVAILGAAHAALKPIVK